MTPPPPRLAQRCYVIFAEPTDRAKDRAVATAAHLAWLARCDAEGTLVIAGPFVAEDGTSTGGGMFIIRAADLADAERIAASDPYNAGGYRTARIVPWRLDQAAIALVPALQS